MTFYHCEAGGVWVLGDAAQDGGSVTSSATTSSSEASASCELCVDMLEDGAEVGDHRSEGMCGGLSKCLSVWQALGTPASFHLYYK